MVRQHVGKDVTLEQRIFHPEALASAHHYGSRCGSVHTYRAKTKGKVESRLPHVRERLLRGHSFTSYEEANIAWLSWSEEVARQRRTSTTGDNAIVTFAGIDKVIVVQNGKALEKPITTGRKEVLLRK